MVVLVKVRTSVLIEAEILKKAQQLGLNVSQYCENALKIGIEALTNSLQKTAEIQTASEKTDKGVSRTVGFGSARAAFIPAELPALEVSQKRTYISEFRAFGKAFT